MMFTPIGLLSIFASITGAWIETLLLKKPLLLEISRPSRARGLKQNAGLINPEQKVRVHHGRVD